LKAQLGHDGPPTNLWTENLITGAPLERCPVRTIQLAREQRDPIVEEVDRHADVYYPAYRDGFLLVRGGLSDQPARYLELIGAIREVEGKVETKLLAALKKQTDTE
jgi:hypothetical protein